MAASDCESQDAKDLLAHAQGGDTEAFCLLLRPQETRLTDALGELPPERRAVIHLKLWQDRAFEASAEILGIPLKTAASRYRYGLEKLQERLYPRYGELR